MRDRKEKDRREQDDFQLQRRRNSRGKLKSDHKVKPVNPPTAGSRASQHIQSDEEAEPWRAGCLCGVQFTEEVGAGGMLRGIRTSGFLPKRCPAVGKAVTH